MQWVEVLTAKNGNSISIPGIHVVDRENQWIEKQWKERTGGQREPVDGENQWTERRSGRKGPLDGEPVDREKK